jgi:hypothetical protein
MPLSRGGLSGSCMQTTRKWISRARSSSLRFFGGYAVEEVADCLGVAVSTVESDFRKATAFLRRCLAEQREDST